MRSYSYKILWRVAAFSNFYSKQDLKLMLPTPEILFHLNLIPAKRLPKDMSNLLKRFQLEQDLVSGTLSRYCQGLSRCQWVWYGGAWPILTHEWANSCGKWVLQVLFDLDSADQEEMLQYEPQVTRLKWFSDSVIQHLKRKSDFCVERVRALLNILSAPLDLNKCELEDDQLLAWSQSLGLRVIALKVISVELPAISMPFWGEVSQVAQKSERLKQCQRCIKRCWNSHLGPQGWSGHLGHAWTNGTTWNINWQIEIHQ